MLSLFCNEGGSDYEMEILARHRGLLVILWQVKVLYSDEVSIFLLHKMSGLNMLTFSVISGCQ